MKKVKVTRTRVTTVTKHTHNKMSDMFKCKECMSVFDPLPEPLPLCQGLKVGSTSTL